MAVMTDQENAGAPYRKYRTRLPLWYIIDQENVAQMSRPCLPAPMLKCYMFVERARVLIAHTLCVRMKYPCPGHRGLTPLPY